MDKKITNYIAKINVIDAEICDSIVEKTNDWKWNTHHWYDYKEDSATSNGGTEPLVCYPGDYPEYIKQQLMMHVTLAYKQYIPLISELNSEINPNVCKGWSMPRFNKYVQGSKMDPHYDHIQSLFDGQAKGIPIISVVGCLNDAYEGGEFYFYEDFKIELEKGDILMFPSNFMYPHRVEPLTSGVRHTFVTWGI